MCTKDVFTHKMHVRLHPPLHLIYLHVSPMTFESHPYPCWFPGWGCRSMEVFLYLACEMGWDLQIEDKRVEGHSPYRGN